MEERLKKFTTLVSCGTFTQAAKELHISQPALTNMIQKLEAELKTQLLVRPSKKVSLTAAGRLAFERGKNLLLADKNFKDELAHLNGGKPAFNVGCIDSLAYHSVASRLLDGLEDRTQLTLTIQNSSEILRSLRRGQLDIGIIVDQEDSLPELARYKLGRESFSLVCAPSREKEFQEALSHNRLPDFLSYNQDSNTFRVLELQFAEAEIKFEPKIFSTNPSVLLQLVVQGKGIAALPSTMLGQASDSEVKQLKTDFKLTRGITAYWRKGQHLPRVMIPLWRSLASSNALEFS
jgi:DNA-binding transcriptional LysR family regulator